MGVLKFCGFTSKRAILPELSTAVGSVKLTGKIPPLASFWTTIGCCGQFWKTGVSLSKLFRIRRVICFDETRLTDTRRIPIIVPEKRILFGFVASH